MHLLRSFQALSALLLCAGCVMIVNVGTVATAAAPNVLLIMTDDQGYGDIAAHGNTMIQTPALDRLHAESVRLTNFHVDPTCSPTRSALMTGRYSTRTGVWHTIQGRSFMDPAETTLAEVFAANGYRTGHFGKWHLGDNAPLRPQDQGFEEVLMCGGGGVTQTPDWWGNDYFDDVYRDESGRPEQFSGYCTDVWFREATRFIEESQQQQRPFFCYLPTNAPHGPYNVADEYADPYRQQGVPRDMAKFYGMITNIDENVGRLLVTLDQRGLTNDTIVIFMTDNGTAAGVAGRRESSDGWQGFNAGMRGQKGSQYDGGHRVPCFIRWPDGQLSGGRDIDVLAAHVDLLPTLAELCGLNFQPDRPLDGRSLVPVLRRTSRRRLVGPTLFVHSQRIEFVQKWRNSAVMTQQWRLVDGKQLYDMSSDPGQQQDIAGQHPDVVKRLTAAYEGWWESLSPVFYEYVRIDLGSPAENPASLTCHDWHTGDKPVPWHQGMVANDPPHNGDWAVNVVEQGRYRFTLRTRPAGVVRELPPGVARVEIGGQTREIPVEAGQLRSDIELTLPAGPAMLRCSLVPTTGEPRGAYFVDVERLGE
ncbi:MAG: arylsulfatase [Planctomycetaceae bacterium]